MIYRFDVFLDSVKLLFEWQKKTSLKLTNKSFISEQKKKCIKGSILEKKIILASQLALKHKSLTNI